MLITLNNLFHRHLIVLLGISRDYNELALLRTSVIYAFKEDLENENNHDHVIISGLTISLVALVC